MPLYKIMILSLTVLSLTACGIKPGSLTAPSAKTDKEQVFPRQYPDPEL